MSTPKVPVNPPDRRQLVRTLLKGIETGSEEAAAVVNEAVYIQHNPRTKTGSEGLSELFKRLSKTNPRVTIVRAFQDGDFVFAHTDYLFGYPEVGFELFRFDGSQAVEHWDNLQHLKGPSPSGHTMLDGPTEAEDLELTEANRIVVRSFVEEVVMGRQLDTLDTFVDSSYTEHSPRVADGVVALREALEATHEDGLAISYEKVHRVLAEGNFVLAIVEGHLDGVHASFFDMFRVSSGKIVEHWGTVDPVAPRSEWKNENGKFKGLLP